MNIIKSISKDRIERRLVLNESVILVDKHDSLNFPFQDKKTGINIDLTFSFTDEGEKYTSSLSTDANENVLNVTLHGWYSDTFLETIEPWVLIRNDHKIWIVWRIFGDENNIQKVFHLTVWVEEK